ncbi:hypothetical protein [uncultured Alcanivorax sp.]|jgi:hypothetical protein|uniref:hypothetical protein n=1 Tax=uncultured Alcanivorax sp. TaxID=191215 RepID=UPI00258B2E0E|nr:hypothetical protein [uncultured Alcanivorax sp.]
MSVPEGMMPIEEFAKSQGLTTDKAIEMIKNGYHPGKEISGVWFAAEFQRRPAKEATGGPEEIGLVLMLNVLAWLSVLSGLIVCYWLWPGDAGYGREWKEAASMTSITWLLVGIVQGVIFATVAKGLSLLGEIAHNTRN